MNAWLSILAIAMAALSAVALYAGSPHCMWRGLRGRPRTARAAATALTVLSLLIWTGVLGFAAGLCATLVSGMLMLVMQPWLALFLGSPDADVTPMEKE